MSDTPTMSDPHDCRMPEQCVEIMRRNDHRLNRLDKAVFGNGSPENSIIVKIDRIDRNMKMNNKVTLFIMIQLAAVITSVIIEWIKGKM